MYQFKTVLYNVLEYNELEKIICEYYKRDRNDTSLIESNEWNNYSCYNFTIEDKPYSEFELKYDLERLEKFKSGGEMCTTHIILQDLANNGVIPFGNYLIEVFW